MSITAETVGVTEITRRCLGSVTQTDRSHGRMVRHFQVVPRLRGRGMWSTERITAGVLYRLYHAFVPKYQLIDRCQNYACNCKVPQVINKSEARLAEHAITYLLLRSPFHSAGIIVQLNWQCNRVPLFEMRRRHTSVDTMRTDVRSCTYRKTLIYWEVAVRPFFE